MTTIGHVMLDIEGGALTPEDRDVLCHPQVGGVILFSRNYQNPDQLKQLVAAIREVRSPLLIAVDQEGGRVQRFREGFSNLSPLGDIGKQYDAGQITTALEKARQHAITMAQELMEADIDFSFAPVLDLDKGHNAVVSNRSFSRHPETVIALGQVYIQALHSVGMPAVGKHFPGHGNTTVDSHHGIAQDTQSYESMAMSDLLPFKALAAQLDAIMPAHVIYTTVDPIQPAGFSMDWLQAVLRQELGFQGAIFSDDIMMSGACVGGTPQERAALALLAGCDMILVCNHRKAACQVLDSLSNVDASSIQRLMALTNKKTLST